MIFRTFLSMILAASLLLPGSLLLAQEETEGPEAPADTEEAEPGGIVLPEDEALTYGDYTVKAYTITAFAGNFSGATYLDNKPLGPRTLLAPGYGDIMGFDGSVLRVSQDATHYTGAQKEIQTGPGYGGRIGIYISDDFHLDLSATFASAKVITTMLYTKNPDTEPEVKERIQVDEDPGYNMIKGGLALMYDATPAKFFGLVPRLGFGLGGLINRYSELSDVTGLYLEGNFGLNAHIAKNLQFGAQVDVTNFAFEVEELGYSNMVNYVTYTFGITWFLDALPPSVRAAHLAEEKN